MLKKEDEILDKKKEEPVSTEVKKRARDIIEGLKEKNFPERFKPPDQDEGDQEEPVESGEND